MGKQTPPILTETTVSNAALAEQAAKCLEENSAEPLSDPAEARQEFEQHLLYLAEAVQAKERSLFTDYIEWLQQQAGSNAGYLKAQLHCVRGVLEGYASPEQAETIAAYLTTAASCVDNACDGPVSFIPEQGPLVDEARAYLDAVLGGRRHEALDQIRGLAESGTPVKSIYLDIFQKVQYEIGRLWQLNKISVAQEHFCTAVTQMAIAQLYPYIFATKRVGKTLVSACVGGELHELGPRMVADFFEMAGWDTYYLGANTPNESVLHAVVDQRADVVGISVTMTYYVHKARELIEYLRAELGDGVRILVGGYPFVVSPGLYKEIGADASAQDAEEAVRVATRLVQAE
ncbi:MAG: cobalamin B12-binding domain-containing protein [Thermodesulfobacteriota bacterium]